MVFDFASDEVLLDIEAICKKLSISRTTFERLRNPQRRLDHERMKSFITGDHSDDYTGMAPFPQPKLTLGRSPRWSVSDLNVWISTKPVVTPASLAKELKNS